MSTAGLFAVLATGAAFLLFLFVVSPRSIKRLGCRLIAIAEGLEYVHRSLGAVQRGYGVIVRSRAEELRHKHGVDTVAGLSGIEKVWGGGLEREA